MNICLWVLFVWFSLEQINALWEIRHNQASKFAPLGLFIGLLYNKLYGKSRWKKLGMDRVGIFTHLVILNLVLPISVFLWGSELTPNIWGIILLLSGIVLQLAENMMWSKNGLAPVFASWSTHIHLIRATGEIEKDEKKRLEKEIRAFSPSQILPLLVVRVLVIVAVISLVFAGIYHQLLITNPGAFQDSDKKPVSYTDYGSLISYSVETTASGSSDMKATIGLSRAIYALHKVCNIFIFSLLIGNIVIISQEQINQNKKELLEVLSGDKSDATTPE